FTAAFLKARLDGWTDTEAALLANAAGAASAEVVGAADGMPDRSRLRAIISRSPLPGPWEDVRRRVLDRLQQEVNATPKPEGA
ncbi:MAG: hypothetical protein ACREIB_07370, partial [Pseudomonadota bacterium]